MKKRFVNVRIHTFCCYILEPKPLPSDALQHPVGGYHRIGCRHFNHMCMDIYLLIYVCILYLVLVLVFLDIILVHFPLSRFNPGNRENELETERQS